MCEKSHLELISALEGQGAIVHVGRETFEESDGNVSVSERERFANESPRLVDSDLIRSLPVIVSVANRVLSLSHFRGGEGDERTKTYPVLETVITQFPNHVESFARRNVP